MNTSDLINAILAGLTFIGIVIALVLGIRSINETRKMQRAQFIQRFVDDITEWVLNIDKCEIGVNLVSVTEAENAFKDGNSAKTHWGIVTGKLANEYWKMSDIGKKLTIMYAGIIAPVLKDVNKLIDLLKQWGDYHDKYRERFVEVPADIIKVRDLVLEWDKNQEAFNRQYREIKKIIADKTYSLSLTLWL